MKKLYYPGGYAFALDLSQVVSFWKATDYTKVYSGVTELTILIRASMPGQPVTKVISFHYDETTHIYNDLIHYWSVQIGLQ